MHGIRLRSLAPALPALLLLAALLPMLGSDPATGVTISRSPFTDEGYNLLNARNVALLGQWSTGDWNLHLVNGPFSPAMAGIFTVFGVGLEPARLLSIAVSAAAVTAVGISVAAAFGSVAGTVAGLALAGQALYLYYGRLALLEPMVTFFLVAGAVVLVRQTDTRAGHGGLAGGLLLALAVATKPSAAFAALGICVGLLLLGAVQRDAWWRGLAAVGGLGLGVFGWLVVVALPNLSAVATDLRIWPAETPPGGVGEAWERVSSYVTASDGALPTTLPLASVALLGLVLAVGTWRRRSPAQQRIVALSVGWFVLGMFVLLLVPYRPNRYLVPLLPPLAMLAGVTVCWVLEQERAWRAVRWTVVAVLGVVLVAPGAGAYAGWAGDAHAGLVDGQRTIASKLAPGDSISGELAPTLAMTAPVTIYVTRRAAGLDVDLPAGEPDWLILEGEDATASASDGCVMSGAGIACLLRTP